MSRTALHCSDRMMSLTADAGRRGKWKNSTAQEGARGEGGIDGRMPAPAAAVPIRTMTERLTSLSVSLVSRTK